MGIGLGLSKSKSKSTQDTTSSGDYTKQATAPEWAQQGLQGLSGSLLGLGGQDPSSFVAGPSGLQQNQFALADYMGQQSAGNQATGQATMRNLTGYSAPDGAVDPSSAFGSLGAADPSQALASALSGAPNNPYLASMNQANINQGLQGYNDALGSAANTLTRSVLPAIRGGAQLAGGYGGSRQGIAEGVALGDLGTQLGQNARNLAQSAMDSGNQLYGGAYESAQDRAANVAMGLAGMGLNNAQGNASRTLQGDLAGAGIRMNAAQGLQNAGLADYDALAGAGATQQGLNQQQAQAPLDLQGWLSQQWSGLPFNIVTGETGTENSKSNMKGTGSQLGVSASASYGGK